MSVLLQNPLLDGEHGHRELLSVWNQHAPRVYVSVILAFPFEDRGATVEKTKRHLKACLDGLAYDRPLLSARVQAESQSGYIRLVQSPKHDIPFTWSEHPGEYDYEQMKAAGFPPHLFITPWFKSGPCGSTSPEPVSRVHAFFPRGGLMLAIYVHHAICDGDSLRLFVEYFAAKTRGAAVSGPYASTFDDRGLRALGDLCRRSPPPFEKLIEATPEYTILPDLSGPTQPRFLADGTPADHIKKTGKIFVFQNSSIGQLQEMVRREHNLPPDKPTKYQCLAALTFSHIIKARIENENFLCNKAGVRWEEARLWNSVSWKKRAFQDLTREYLGNSTLPVVTKAPTRLLVEACTDIRKFARVVLLIKESIDVVDETYIRQRLAMLASSSDPRYVGVDYDPRMPNILAFNTWRHFGADAQWAIPGVSASCPEAIRRGHASWNLGTALILPANATSGCQELFVSLPEVSMDALCRDEEWLRWVDKCIG